MTNDFFLQQRINMSSLLNCGDQSFGLVPRDISISNARVNQVLSTCNGAASSNPNPLVTGYNSVRTPWTANNFNSVKPKYVLYDVIENDTDNMAGVDTSEYPHSFFTIPESGVYEISSVAVCSFDANGEGRSALYVNDIPRAYFGQTDGDGIQTLSGAITQNLVAGDVVKIAVLVNSVVPGPSGVYPIVNGLYKGTSRIQNSDLYIPATQISIRKWMD